MKENLPLLISILSLVVSFFTFALTTWLYRRISESQIDDNIINVTDSVLALLEKAKTLEPREKRLLVDWLNDWEYFRPPRSFRFLKKSRPWPKDTTIENLKQYFNELVADDQ